MSEAWTLGPWEMGVEPESRVEAATLTLPPSDRREAFLAAYHTPEARAWFESRPGDDVERARQSIGEMLSYFRSTPSHGGGCPAQGEAYSGGKGMPFASKLVTRTCRIVSRAIVGTIRSHHISSLISGEMNGRSVPITRSTFASVSFARQSGSSSSSMAFLRLIRSRSANRNRVSAGRAVGRTARPEDTTTFLPENTDA